MFEGVVGDRRVVGAEAAAQTGGPLLGCDRSERVKLPNWLRALSLGANRSRIRCSIDPANSTLTPTERCNTARTWRVMAPGSRSACSRCPGTHRETGPPGDHRNQPAVAPTRARSAARFGDRARRARARGRSRCPDRDPRAHGSWPWCAAPPESRDRPARLGDRASERWAVGEQRQGQPVRERRGIRCLEEIDRGDVGVLTRTDRDRGIGDRRLARAPRAGENGVHAAEKSHRDLVNILLAADHRLCGQRVIGREQHRAGNSLLITHD